MSAQLAVDVPMQPNCSLIGHILRFGNRNSRPPIRTLPICDMRIKFHEIRHVTVDDRRSSALRGFSRDTDPITMFAASSSYTRS